MVSSSSRSKLLAMFSNISSIFAMTSRVAGRRVEAIEDEMSFYEMYLIKRNGYSLKHGWHSKN